MGLRTLLHRACARAWHDRITVVGREHLPARGPTLFVSRHRNGAVDGFVLAGVLPHHTFLIARNLRKGALGRLFFAGIEVVRDKDGGDRSINAAALDKCVALLRRGGRLVVFPEGTSSLGPQPLPLKHGAARILEQALAAGVPVTVIPVGLHYECAWAFRSHVEVRLGAPIPTALPADLDAHARVDELHRRIADGLAEVGASFASEEDQDRAERLAYAATLGTSRAYSDVLLRLARGVPEPVARIWSELEPGIRVSRAFLHQGIPLVPLGPFLPYLAGLVLTAPVVGLAAFLNLPPVLAAWWAGRTLPDDRNVIALWRLIVGVPVAALWTLAVGAALLSSGHPLLLALYLAVSWLGVRWWYRFKKLAVTVGNVVRAPDLALKLRSLHAILLEELPA